MRNEDRPMLSGIESRGVIARASGEGWEGVDFWPRPQPTRVGPLLWRCLQEQFGGDVAAFLADATDEGLGRRYCSCPTPRSCSCGGRRFIGRSGHIQELGPCSEKCVPRLYRWVYVFSPTALTVFATVCFSSVSISTDGAGYVDVDGNVHLYRHVRLGVFPLHAPEPDWDALERRLLELKRQPRACPHQRLAV